MICPIWSGLSLSHLRLHYCRTGWHSVIPRYCLMPWSCDITKYSIPWIHYQPMINCHLLPTCLSLLIFHLWEDHVVLGSVYLHDWELTKYWSLSSHLASRSTVSRSTASRSTPSRSTASAKCILVTESLQECVRGGGVYTWKHQFQEGIRPYEGIPAGLRSNWDLWWLVREHHGSGCEKFGSTWDCSPTNAAIPN